MRVNQSFILMFLFFLINCNSENDESERERTIRLLAGDSFKEWSVIQVFEDEIEQPTNICDSSYVMTLKTDFTWHEVFLNVMCYSETDGTWLLNEENNVITINYISQKTNEDLENYFQIVELSEEYFAYEFVQNNDLKRVRLIAI